MPRKYEHEDLKIRGEFDEVYKIADLYKAQEDEPENPRVGLRWYQPSTDILKIYDGTTWQTIAKSAVYDTAIYDTDTFS
jgi:hypothetical protein